MSFYSSCQPLDFQTLLQSIFIKQIISAQNPQNNMAPPAPDPQNNSALPAPDPQNNSAPPAPDPQNSFGSTGSGSATLIRASVVDPNTFYLDPGSSHLPHCGSESESFHTVTLPMLR